MILKIIHQTIQMFDKIQMTLMMKTSISNNRILRLNNVSCSRYLDFCVFVNSTDFKVCDVIIDNRNYTCSYFLWILSTIKIKFSQLLPCCLTNICNVILARCWRLETNSRSFSDLSFLHFHIYHFHFFKNVNHLNLDINGYWVIGAGC